MIAYATTRWGQAGTFRSWTTAPMSSVAKPRDWSTKNRRTLTRTRIPIEARERVSCGSLR